MKSNAGVLIHCLAIVLSLGCVFLLSANVYAGGGKLTGVVADSLSGEKINLASVLITGTKVGAGTDDSGKYLIRGISPGKYDIRIIASGYAPKTITGVMIESDSTTKIDVFLKRVSLRMKKRINPPPTMAQPHEK